MGGGMMGFVRGADANKDGIITLDEALAHATKQFDTFDRSKDGAVDKADFDLMRKEMADYGVKRFVHQYGGDKDNKVTREQFFAKAKERFARMDFNNDGRIMGNEMPGMGRGMRGEDGGGFRERMRGMMGRDRGGADAPANAPPNAPVPPPKN